MNKSIKTYEDLLQEEQRLLQQLKAHEVLIREDIAGLKEKMKPMEKAFGVLQKMATRDHTGALDFVVIVLRLIMINNFFHCLNNHTRLTHSSPDINMGCTEGK